MNIDASKLSHHMLFRSHRVMQISCDLPIIMFDEAYITLYNKDNKKTIYGE